MRLAACGCTDDADGQPDLEPQHIAHGHTECHADGTGDGLGVVIQGLSRELTMSCGIVQVTPTTTPTSSPSAAPTVGRGQSGVEHSHSSEDE
jgi:hypothetical protein